MFWPRNRVLAEVGGGDGREQLTFWALEVV